MACKLFIHCALRGSDRINAINTINTNTCNTFNTQSEGPQTIAGVNRRVFKERWKVHGVGADRGKRHKPLSPRGEFSLDGGGNERAPVTMGCDNAKSLSVPVDRPMGAMRE